jgi:hypothetical protein
MTAPQEPAATPVDAAPATAASDAPAAAQETAAQEPAEEENGSAERNKTRIIVRALRQIEQGIGNVIRLLEEDVPAGQAALMRTAEALEGIAKKDLVLTAGKPIDGRVVEGVFDGQGMVGSDGKSYTVPPNYASKSKLVEGDMLKLTITPKGSFIYKQIGPIERARVVATLGFDHTNGEFYATEGERRWSVLKASVTYFKGEPGDEVVLLIPKSTPSKWGAVENIIKNDPLI